ncbi:nickel-responsive transcriptional regulator NikR [Variovorax sp. VNK109]|jgi:CopG family nickel-responsive transcriptional regulator|uniref:nickel-responsive transcriptional regulator NikR n=1 Tax=Variovorax sp. VNK109 TaxID=3400919 RepID=UPI003C11B44B
MQRFTISLDDTLAAQFDELIAQRGYGNRSEAVRDLIREKLGTASLDSKKAKWCVASVSYVYDHHEHTVTGRVLGLQHDHHDLVITSLHTHLDHDHCLETVVLRGPSAAVTACAQQLIALRGVRHGNIHIVPLAHEPHAHSHPHGHSHGASKSAMGPMGDRHTHYKPIA